MKRHFYGTYIKDTRLAGGLDLIRFLMEPNAIRFSHVTIRGPYQRRIAQSRLDLELNSQIQDWRVRLTEPCCFFENAQNTVFISVDLGSLRRLWRKPDYPTGVAHLTLYDGNNRKWAKELYGLLCQHRWNLTVDVTPLRYIDDKFQVENTLLNMVLSFTQAYATFLGNAGVALKSVPQLNLEDRLAQVQNVLVKLHLPLQEPFPRHRSSKIMQCQPRRLPGL